MNGFSLKKKRVLGLNHNLEHRKTLDELKNRGSFQKQSPEVFCEKRPATLLKKRL